MTRDKSLFLNCLQSLSREFFVSQLQASCCCQKMIIKISLKIFSKSSSSIEVEEDHNSCHNFAVVLVAFEDSWDN